MKTNNKTHETKPSNPKSKPVQKENTPFAECIILKPVGYPFDFAMMENNLEIIDKASLDAEPITVKSANGKIEHQINAMVRVSCKRKFISFRSENNS